MPTPKLSEPMKRVLVQMYLDQSMCAEDAALNLLGQGHRWKFPTVDALERRGFVKLVKEGWRELTLDGRALAEKSEEEAASPPA